MRRERTGYPTQKPLALLERIIKASSNAGDMVLDPFCGCATALVAADRLQREWVGIDLSKLAIKLVNQRIAADRGGLAWGGATALTEPPLRTDLGDLPNYRTHRHRLYGEQEGVCAGCETHFPFRVMDVDHMLPRSRGGTGPSRQPSTALLRLQPEQGWQDDGRMEGRAMTEKPRKQRRKLPEPRTITLPDQTYQPPKVEREKEYNMPGASLKTVRRAFFRPITVRREGSD